MKTAAATVLVNATSVHWHDHVLIITATVSRVRVGFRAVLPFDFELFAPVKRPFPLVDNDLVFTRVGFDFLFGKRE